jgi:DNA-binding transcriptional ArsR family regulator
VTDEPTDLSAPVELPGGVPDWFDPEHEVMLTPARLKGLLHPIRVRLFTLLEDNGPATATQLARRIGESSGTTSYHLRLLAEHGFIEDDVERSNGRDRWWKPKYRGSSFTFRSTTEPNTRAGVEAGALYIRMLADTYYQRMVTFTDGLSARIDEIPDMPWTFGVMQLELTRDEARALNNEVWQLLKKYQREPTPHETPEGRLRGVFQYQMLPEEGVA